MLKMVEPGDKGSECLLRLRLYTFAGLVTLISAHAPTLTFTPEARDEFYTNLKEAIKNIYNSDRLVLLGDLNARVSADHDSWSSCLGSFGMINENGQHLLELCSYHGFCVTNSYFQMKPQHSVMAPPLIQVLAPARHGHC